MWDDVYEDSQGWVTGMIYGIGFPTLLTMINHEFTIINHYKPLSTMNLPW